MPQPTPISASSGRSETPEPDPWYADGLAFECTGCGGCCTGEPGYVWVTTDELVAIADYLDKPIGEVRLMDCKPVRGLISLSEHRNGDCVYLNPHTRRCTVYPVRPKQCRTWPFWPEIVKTPQAWKAAGRSCPGIDRGEFVPLASIEATLADSGIPDRESRR